MVQEIMKQLDRVNQYIDAKHRLGEYDTRAVYELYGEKRQLEHLVKFASKTASGLVR